MPEMLIVRRWMIVTWAALLLGCLCLVFGTAFNGAFWRSWTGTWEEAPALYRFLVQTDLGREDAVSAWYSSMLLLLMSIVGLLCWVADREPDYQRTRFGWIILSAIFMALSLTELGSIHERVPSLSGNLGLLAWLAPFFIMVPGYMLFFAWVQSKRNRAAVAWLTAGVLMLSTVPAQEYFEIHAFQNQPGWQRPMAYLLLEEGTELFGMLCWIAALATFLWGLAVPTAEGRAKRSIALPAKPKALVAVVLALTLVATASMLAAIRFLTPSDIFGTTQNWFPSAAMFSAMALCSYAASTQPDQAVRCAAWLAALTSLAVSGYIGSNLHGLHIYPQLRFTLLGLVIATTFATLMVSKGGQQILAFATGALFGTVLHLQGDAAAFAALGASAVLVICAFKVFVIGNRGTAAPSP